MRDWNFLAKTPSQDRERSRSPVKAEESPKMPFPLPPSLTITAKHKELHSPGKEKEAKSKPDSTSYPSDKLQQVIIWNTLSKLVSNCTALSGASSCRDVSPAAADADGEPRDGPRHAADDGPGADRPPLLS